MSVPMPLLKLERVAKDYAAAGDGAFLPVLREISLEIHPGESVAIVGPSGSGKSTLLNIMGTLDRPTKGEVVFDGTSLNGLSEADLAAFRNRRIGFVFQAHHLLPHCSAWENVLVPTLAAKGTDASARAGSAARAEQLLRRVGLGDRLRHRPGQLSGGERQRVAVARALINQPPLLLADEPTGALDRAAAEALGDLLVDLNRQEGVTLVVVTHALDLAQRMGSVMELRDGVLKPIAKSQ
ncbi:MAG: ABC transporter ATP-binding protein [Verrucomicrobia bacterium]|nr:ABC transporter ATP-binding protein [Verrucomicrobiota bacterium]